MAMQVSELIQWLNTLPQDAEIWIDEGGLSLEGEDFYYEVGGEPEDEEVDD
jgi:hypothetical protein